MAAGGSRVPPGGLQERADQLALVQEAMGIITWIWDLEPEETRWYGDLSGLLGLLPGQFEGDFAHFLRCLHPDDVDPARERLRRCLKGQIQSYHTDQRVLWPDGSVHWLETYGRRTAGPDGRTLRIVGVIQDITERRQAQWEMEAHERRLRQLIEEAPVAIGMSRGPLVSYVNPAFMRIFGASRPEQLVGRPVLELTTPPQQVLQQAREARRRAGQVVERHYEIEARRIDGSAFECLVSVSQLSLAEDGDTLVFLEDISERRSAERAMKALNAGLEQRVAERTQELALARDAAEAATRAKAEFLANMSHEIRTPMNAVLGFTELALRGDVNPRLRNQLGNIHRAAHSLLGIINDILDYSKIESGKLVLEHAPFALDEVLARVGTMLSLEAGRKGLLFLVDLEPAAPPRLMGDALRLQQVLLNLCSNAVKFTAAGEVIVRARLRPAGARQVLDLSVTDTGIGIGEAQLQRLFTPFDQLDTSTTRRYGGTGLGLVISRQLLDLMGGSIQVHSQPGEGSVFAVRLVLDTATADAPAPVAAPELRNLPVMAVGAGRWAELMGRQLAALGCRVIAQPALPSAQAVAAAAPAVVLVDSRLPGAAPAAAGWRGPAGGPVALLAGPDGSEALSEAAQQGGYTACLGEPLVPAALRDALLAALRAAPAGPAPGGGRAPPPPELAGCRILLAEDNELNQIVAVEFLVGLAQARVRVAGTGLEALDWLQREPFDLVLMDVQMPGIDGFEATARIRADPRLAGLPVIAMTAHATVRDRQRCVAAGMNDFVGKPFEVAELFAVLRHWIAPRADAPLPPVAAAEAPHDGTVSIEAGLARCLGREDLFRRALGRFMATEATERARFEQALAAGDTATLARLAHAMVSTASMLGADALSAAARELQWVLEEASKEGPDAPWQPPAQRYLRLHAGLVAALAAWLSRPAA